MEIHKCGTYPNLGNRAQKAFQSLSYDLKEILGADRSGELGGKREQQVQRQGVGTQCAGRLKVSQ